MEKSGKWITVKGTHIFISDENEKDKQITEFLEKRNYISQESILKEKINTRTLQIKKQEKKIKNLKNNKNKENLKIIEEKTKQIEKWEKELLETEKQLNELIASDKYKQAKKYIEQKNQEAKKAQTEIKQQREFEQQKKQEEKRLLKEQQEQKKNKRYEELSKGDERLKQFAKNFNEAEEMQSGGYSGYSMSNRAEKAYKKGFVPMSKLNSAEKKIAQMLGSKEWHHSSKYANKVEFYDKNIIDLIKDNADIETLKQYLEIENEYNTSAWHIYDEDDLKKWEEIKIKYQNENKKRKIKEKINNCLYITNAEAIFLGNEY